MIRVLCWENGTAGAPSDASSVDAVRAAGAGWRAGSGNVWLDVTVPTQAEMELIAAEFELHDVVVRNVLSPNSRPKLFDYGSFIMLALYLPRDPAIQSRGAPPFGLGGRGMAPLSEVDFVFSERYLITAHPDPVPLLQRMMDDTKNGTALMVQGVGGLVHRVLDEAVDSYFPVLDGLVEQVEAIQEFAFVGAGRQEEHDARQAMRPLFRLKKGLLALRRVMAPQADALRVLAREGVAFYQEPEIDFEDIFDRAVRVEQSIQLNQDLLINARESFLTRVANELAIATKALMVITCLFLVPLFVTALYGMRFEIMPELGLPVGHGWALMTIVVTDAALLMTFRRQGWT